MNYLNKQQPCDSSAQDAFEAELDMGTALLKQGEWGEARDHFNHALNSEAFEKQNRDNALTARAHMLLGECCIQQYEEDPRTSSLVEDAKQHLDEALRIQRAASPNVPHNAIATSLASLGRLFSAKAHVSGHTEDRLLSVHYFGDAYEEQLQVRGEDSLKRARQFKQQQRAVFKAVPIVVLLTGASNTGKTTLLRQLQFAMDCTQLKTVTEIARTVMHQQSPKLGPDRLRESLRSDGRLFADYQLEIAKMQNDTEQRILKGFESGRVESPVMICDRCVLDPLVYLQHYGKSSAECEGTAARKLTPIIEEVRQRLIPECNTHKPSSFVTRLLICKTEPVPPREQRDTERLVMSPAEQREYNRLMQRALDSHNFTSGAHQITLLSSWDPDQRTGAVLREIRKLRRCDFRNPSTSAKLETRRKLRRFYSFCIFATLAVSANLLRRQ